MSVWEPHASIRRHIAVSRDMPRQRRLAIACSTAIFLSLGAPAAFAQSSTTDTAGTDTAASPAATTNTDKKSTTDLEQVTVSASRILRDGFVAPTPTTTITAVDIQNSAATNIAETINQMPSVRPSFNMASTTNNSQFSGGNFLDLRGIGFNRTLVLVDGKRVVPNQVLGGVDINTLPQALIESVDVVTGGASAAWGSDAVAGVVNFRLNQDLEGVKGVVKGGISGHHDRQNSLTSIAFGTSFSDKRGHLLFAAESAHNKGIGKLRDRSWGAQQWSIISNPAYTANNDEPRQLLLPDTRDSNMSYGGLINAGPLKGTQFDNNGDPVPFQYGTLVSSTKMVGGDSAAASSQDNYTLEAPLDRHSLYGRMSYAITPDVTAAVDASWSKSETTYRGLTRTDSGLTIHRDNPFLPASIGSAMDDLGLSTFKMGRYDRDYGQGVSNKWTDTARVVGSLSGYFGETWSWDAYYGHGRSETQLRTMNNRITPRFNYALDATTDPLTGAAICRSTSPDAVGCVPIDLFGDGAPSAQSLAYILGTSQTNYVITQDNAAATLHGEPFSMPAGPVSVATGIDWRRETAKVTSDPLSMAAVFATGNTVPWNGGVSVKEAFGEALFPLASEAAWARSLDLDLAARITNYSTSGTVVTWKIGGNWQVNDWLRFRGTQSRDIRAPSLYELYNAGGTSSFTVFDPLVNQTYNVPSISTGNADLKPEEADTTTVGFVLSPTPDLMLSLDYYKIDIKKAIITFQARDIVERCYGAQPQVCGSIVRGADGNIDHVNVSPQNLQSVKVEGLDLEVGYRALLGPGKLNLRGLASYTKSVQLDDGITSTEMAGSTKQPTIASVGGTPHWKGSVNASYSAGPYAVNAAVRYIGGGRIDNTYTSKDLNILETSGRTYFDLGGSYDLRSSDDSKITLFLSVHNLFDKNPPITGAGGYVTTRSLYDYIGRAYSAGVRFKF